MIAWLMTNLHSKSKIVCILIVIVIKFNTKMTLSSSFKNTENFFNVLLTDSHYASGGEPSFKLRAKYL